MLTFEQLANLGNIIKEAIKWFTPGIIIIISLLTVYALIRWSKKITIAYKEISETPWGIALFIIIVVFLLIAWFGVAAYF